MKVTPLWASIALFCAPAVLAQSTTTASTTTTSPAPSCTASQIASLCSYPEPGPDFAIASDSRAFCWDYCNSHTPCNFVIFVAGNPNTGTGTCWLYPGETFDASAGSSDCGNPTLSVYSQPVCAGGSPTAGACAATATPSAVASVCGYPTPGDCFSGCTASDGASNCLSQCAEADSCSYVVFNPHNPSNSPFSSGTCWIYPNGTFDASAATTCSGDPEQFVYNNLCPKPEPKPSSSSSSSSSSLSPTSISLSPSGTAVGYGNGGAGTTTGSNAGSTVSTPMSLLLSSAMVLGMFILTCQAI